MRDGGVGFKACYALLPAVTLNTVYNVYRLEAQGAWWLNLHILAVVGSLIPLSILVGYGVSRSYPDVRAYALVAIIMGAVPTIASTHIIDALAIPYCINAFLALASLSVAVIVTYTLASTARNPLSSSALTLSVTLTVPLALSAARSVFGDIALTPLVAMVALAIAALPCMQQPVGGGRCEGSHGAYLRPLALALPVYVVAATVVMGFKYLVTEALTGIYITPTIPIPKLALLVATKGIAIYALGVIAGVSIAPLVKGAGFRRAVTASLALLVAPQLMLALVKDAVFIYVAALLIGLGSGVVLLYLITYPALVGMECSAGKYLGSLVALMPTSVIASALIYRLVPEVFGTYLAIYNVNTALLLISVIIVAKLGVRIKVKAVKTT